MYWKLTPGFKLTMVSNSAIHLCHKHTKIMAKQKNLEKMFSFTQSVPWGAAILVKVSCAYRPGSGNIFEPNDLTLGQLSFLSWQDMVPMGWALTQPSFLLLPMSGTWGSINHLQGSLWAKKAEDHCIEDGHGHSLIWSICCSVSRVRNHGLISFCLLFTTGKNNLCNVHLSFGFSLAFPKGAHKNHYHVLLRNDCHF